MKTALMCSLLIGPLFAQEKQPVVSKELTELRKKVVDELTKMRADMVKKSCPAEALDCESIAGKIMNPKKMISGRSGSGPTLSEKDYDAVLDAWSELGVRLSKLYTDGAADLKEKEKEEAELFAGWFATFPDLAKGVRHLNRRRKFCKMSPVTLAWAPSIGGYLHSLYLKQNANDPGVAGLGAHNEDPKLAGYSPEGAEAAGGILGGGSPEMVMDSWLGSAYHRDPVFDRSCGRIAFGGTPGRWSCKRAGGTAGKILSNVVSFPGDGDTDIPCTFAGEAPNPLPNGMMGAGTFVVVQFFGTAPRKPVFKLLDAEDREVPIIALEKYPVQFVAKEPLKSGVKYKVEVSSEEGLKHSFTFTTK